MGGSKLALVKCPLSAKILSISICVCVCVGGGGKNGQNNRLAPLPLELVPPSGKSLICHCNTRQNFHENKKLEI